MDGETSSCGLNHTNLVAVSGFVLFFLVPMMDVYPASEVKW